MKDRTGQLSFKVTVFNDAQPVNAEEVLGEERVEELEQYLQNSADAWLQDSMTEHDPYLEAQVEVQ